MTDGLLVGETCGVGVADAFGVACFSYLEDSAMWHALLVKLVLKPYCLPVLCVSMVSWATELALSRGECLTKSEILAILLALYK